MQNKLENDPFCITWTYDGLESRKGKEEPCDSTKRDDEIAREQKAAAKASRISTAV